MTQRMVESKPLLINGEWRTTGTTIESMNPATGALLGLASVGGIAEVDAAVRAAQAAFPAWRATDERERQHVLQRLHDVLAERQAEIASLISSETGKPPLEALTADLLVALDALKYYVKHGAADIRPERLKLGQRLLRGHEVQVVYEPAGVVGIIGPWNVPLAIPLTQIIAALIVGDTVVFKPSEWTSLIGHAIADICVAAAVPHGVINVVMGDGATGAALAAHPGVRRIIFTGSVATGRRVAVTCAERLCPCILELGGVGAAIVRADADPDTAARGIVWSGFINNGQVCVGAQRVYVDQQIAAPLTGAIVRETRKLRVGGNDDGNYDLGPLINQQAVVRMEQQVADAVAGGAKVLLGGTRQPERGPNYFAPTVLTDVAATMSVMREETFGPLLAIMPVADDDEALAQANSLPLGLATTIWSRDNDAALAMSRQINSGMVWINEGPVYYADPSVPWGGVQESGIGRTHGRWGLQALADVKVIARSQHGTRPWWFPYRPRVRRVVAAFIALQHAPGWRAKVRGIAEAYLMR